MLHANQNYISAGFLAHAMHHVLRKSAPWLHSLDDWPCINQNQIAKLECHFAKTASVLQRELVLNRSTSSPARVSQPLASRVIGQEVEMVEQGGQVQLACTCTFVRSCQP